MVGVLKGRDVATQCCESKYFPGLFAPDKCRLTLGIYQLHEDTCLMTPPHSKNGRYNPDQLTPGYENINGTMDG